MRFQFVVAFAAVASLAACAQAAQPTPKTDDEKALYSLGVLLSRNVQAFEFTDKELEMVKAGLSDGSRGKEKLDQAAMEAVTPKLDQLYRDRVAAALTREKAAGTAFVTKAAAESGARKLDSGMVYKVTQEGTGETPKASDTVKVHYVGKFTDGKQFDSSVERNEPAVFPVEGVISCWTEGLQQMKVGGKAVLTCPPELAYGDEGRPPQMRGGATLVFDVELIEIMKAEAGTEAAAAPAQ